MEWSGDKNYDRFCEILEAHGRYHGFSDKFMKDTEFEYAEYLAFYRDGTLSIDECKARFLTTLIQQLDMPVSF
jgi:hypothetical protein